VNVETILSIIEHAMHDRGIRIETRQEILADVEKDLTPLLIDAPLSSPPADHAAIKGALDELGVPGPGYPAPVANAVGILRRALDIDGDER
jgi:hypothetical protein